MKRVIGYGLLCAALLLLAGGAAATCNHWWDQRICGQGPVEYEGQVLWDFEVFESPISIASPNGWSMGHAIANAETFTFYYSAQGQLFSGTYDEETGCYLDWDRQDGTRIQAFCWDGDNTVHLWYGTIRWMGHGYELQGPWLYHQRLVRITKAMPLQRNTGGRRLQ